MPLFRYRALSRSNDVISGEMEVPDRAVLAARLRSHGQVPLSATPVRPGLRALLAKDVLGKGVTFKILTRFVAQLAELVLAEVDLEQALALMIRIEERGVRQRLAEGLLRRLRDGASLADAMLAERKFPPIAVAMVRAGETSGALPGTLERLAAHLAQIGEAREKIRSALVYPAALLLTGCGSMAVIFTKVLPELKPLIRESGAALPFQSRALFALGDLFHDHAAALFAAFLLLAAGAARAWSEPRLKERRDSLLLRLPFAGKALRKAEAARFVRTLGVLTGAGVPLPTALALARPVLGNSVIAAAAGRAADQVKEGGGLAEALARTAAFPEIVTHLARIGETTGKFDQMLTRAADILDGEVRNVIERALSLLVPALTIGLGLVVAVLVSGVLSAILSVDAMVQ